MVTSMDLHNALQYLDSSVQSLRNAIQSYMETNYDNPVTLKFNNTFDSVICGEIECIEYIPEVSVFVVAYSGQKYTLDEIKTDSTALTLLAEFLADNFFTEV